MTLEEMLKQGNQLHIVWAPVAEAFMAELWKRDYPNRITKPFGLGSTIDEALKDLLWASEQRAQCE